VYQLYVEGIVLYYWSSLRCIKIWIVIYYRGLKFPHRAAVLLVLESDGACTGLNGHCARKSIVLVLVCCYKARGDREQDLWRYWLPEGCIKKWYDQPQQQVWTGGAMKQWPCCISYLGQALWHTEWKNKIKTLRLSPLTGVHIDIADSRVLPVMFHRSLSILSGCPIINIHSCHQYKKLSWLGPMEYHPHIRFHYSKLPNYLSYDYGSFIKISGIDLDESGCMQVLKWLRC